MIKRLKIRFVTLSMTALFLLLAVIIGGMNILNYSAIVEEADDILNILSQNKGTFPGITPDIRPIDRPGFSPELPYESRFFTVAYSKAGNVVSVDTSRIAAIDQSTAMMMAENALSDSKTRDFIGQYRYCISQDMDIIRVTFLDCGNRLDAFYRFCTSSIVMSLLGYILVFIVIFILSGRIIRPIAESYEKQRQFITDAGHEIKTPLTIINANADILEMELGRENESLTDIKAQTARLRTLTEQLVQLSRMEEMEDTLATIAFPLSEVAAEELRHFHPLAVKDNKTLTCRIEPMITLNGNANAIRQLISILMENAMKYTEPGDSIAVTLAKQGHSIALLVSNTTAFPVDPLELHHVFDRFYRTDSSRNSETGGHGIGLSIAKAIVTAHGGKIKAATADGKSFTVTVWFPKQ